MQIDAHQHFWQLARGDYDWLTPDLEALHHDFLPADLEAHRQRHGIDATILVQAAATFAETRFLLSLAAETAWVAGVVGWVDFDAERTQVESRLDEIARHPLGLGVRPMIQDIPDPDWMLRTQLAPVFEMLIERDLRFDALVKPVHLSRLSTLLERHPRLRCVIDHAAKPDIAAGQLDAWSGDLARVARESAACCKLSGLPSEAATNWDASSLQPTVERLLECFGYERLLWGSDWPVVEQSRGYRAWRQASETLLSGLDDSQRAGIFGLNASVFYGLESVDSLPSTPSGELHERS